MACMCIACGRRMPSWQPGSADNGCSACSHIRTPAEPEAKQPLCLGPRDNSLVVPKSIAAPRQGGRSVIAQYAAHSWLLIMNVRSTANMSVSANSTCARWAGLSLRFFAYKAHSLSPLRFIKSGDWCMRVIRAECCSSVAHNSVTIAYLLGNVGVTPCTKHSASPGLSAMKSAVQACCMQASMLSRAHPKFGALQCLRCSIEPSTQSRTIRQHPNAGSHKSNTSAIGRHVCEKF
jgi:hypothetical protein